MNRALEKLVLDSVSVFEQYCKFVELFVSE